MPDSYFNTGGIHAGIARMRDITTHQKPHLHSATLPSIENLVCFISTIIHTFT